MLAQTGVQYEIAFISDISANEMTSVHETLFRFFIQLILHFRAVNYLVG